MPVDSVRGIRFQSYGFAIQREPFVRPFHFKGGSFNEKWLNITSLYPGEPSGEPSASRQTAIGGNAVLWSDPAVFAAHSETGGNLVMSLMAERAARVLKEKRFPDPIAAIQSLIPELHEFGCSVSGRTELRPTFSLNASVSLDLALWKLYAAARGIETFFELIPRDCRDAFAARQRAVVRVPLITYNLPERELLDLVDEGHFLLKIKIGQAGGQSEMLQKDLARLEQIHRLLQDRATDQTDNGRLAYYLDANGRYENRETLLALITGLEKLGALEQVVLLEEPFPDDREFDVHDLPLRIAADESLHSVEDVRRKIELGYRAIALKPAGKTLSMSMLMAAEAQAGGIPCFVADSACVPLLLDWNRNVAAHLPPFPGLACGILESNGAQNFRHWSTLMGDHPCAGASWLEAKGGMFRLNEDFYSSAGGVFHPAGNYETLV
ncbi:MAG: mandelate racemase/muconate lactonizing enzyme family protein [Spirochaetaceae bacterium]|nr:MAG: mandelate racemase/muconate lactonizing enzyme family protein [Spirochaetaceae bacterium]